MTADTDTAKRGRGQPKKGRTADLPRIRPEHHAMLTELTAAKGPYLADTLEALIEAAHRKVKPGAGRQSHPQNVAFRTEIQR